jgi:hypothetical protein
MVEITNSNKAVIVNKIFAIFVEKRMVLGLAEGS